MRKLLTSAAIVGLSMGWCVSALGAGSDDNTSIDLKGVAGKTCHFALAPTHDVDNSMGSSTSVTAGADQTSINISSFVDEATAKLVDGTHTITLVYPEVYCNFAHNLSVSTENGGMRNPAGEVPGFVHLLYYRINAQLGDGGPIAGFLTNGTGSTNTSADAGKAFKGSLTVIITFKSGENDTDNPLLAGQFEDTATISLSTEL